jgi:hypothetical protein
MPSRFPFYVVPELALLTQDAPEGDRWLHEVKIERYRLLP